MTANEALHAAHTVLVEHGAELAAADVLNPAALERWQTNRILPPVAYDVIRQRAGDLLRSLDGSAAPFTEAH